jgi:uncharacterized protein
VQSLFSIQRLRQSIKPVLHSQPVVLAYVFGSVARGTADSESDLDIAVLTLPSLSKEQRFDLRLKLHRLLAEALHVDLEQVDLIILQDVPTLLQYNVLRNGQLLFALSPSVHHAFELSVEQRYEDESPYLEREAKMTIERILSHKL